MGVKKTKLSIEKSKKILFDNGDKYSDEEVKRIRDFLYDMTTTIIQDAYIASKKKGDGTD